MIFPRFFLPFIFIALIISYSCNSNEEKGGGKDIVVELLPNLSNSNFRGISMIGDSIIWVSGSKGMVMRSTDGGENWSKFPIPNCPDIDFRDIQAISEKEAIILSAGSPLLILKTSDGGLSWDLRHSDSSKTVFYDGFDFISPSEGIAYGDPIENRISILKTVDGGMNWTNPCKSNCPGVLENEAGFAASGTGITYLQDRSIIFGTGGGKTSRIFKSKDGGQSWEIFPTTMRSGEAGGIYSVAFKDAFLGVIVGGSYRDSTSTQGACEITRDGGKTWTPPVSLPAGYRSSVRYWPQATRFICAGRSGIDISDESGIHWTKLSNEGFYALAIGNNKAFGIGKKGKLIRFSLAP